MIVKNFTVIYGISLKNSTSQGGVLCIITYKWERGLTLSLKEFWQNNKTSIHLRPHPLMLRTNYFHIYARK